jgi:ABC-type multidrug transport system fused ATPase/permease subunit
MPRKISTFAATAWRMIRPLAPAISVVIAALGLEAVLDNAFPFIWGKLTDTLVKHDAHRAIIMILSIFGLGLTTRIVSFVREMYEVYHIDWDINLRIMNQSLERLFGFSMAQIAQTHSGKTRDIVRNGRNAMQQIVFMVVYRLGPSLMNLALATGTLLWFSPLVGSASLTGTAVYLAFSIRLFASHRKPLKELEERGNENGKMFADILGNMDLVMANARQKKTAHEFAEDGEAFAQQGRSFWKYALGWLYLRNSISFLCITISRALMAYLFFKDQFTFGTFIALNQWVRSSMDATSQLGAIQRELSMHWAQMEIYLELLAKPPLITIAPDAVRHEKLRGSIEFQNVTFHYEARHDDTQKEVPQIPVIALNDVSFTIPPGQKVALVGESGAGKSTIAYALMRAKDPESGAIIVDGCDLRASDLDNLRSRIGYVAQEPQLFDRSIRYNLLFGMNGHADAISDEELYAVLASVKLEKLSGDLDKKLGEKGHTLSGGERQRLCIARALIKNPDVLIFDEATSSLDPVNEKKVQDAIDAVGDRTRIIIAHRYSTIRNVDRILVFDSGRLVNDGTHQELVEGCPYYQALLQQQGLF